MDCAGLDSDSLASTVLYRGRKVDYSIKIEYIVSSLQDKTITTVQF